MEKLPPVEKVYEAWTALVDDRYDLSPEALIVRSSDGSKEYRVTWDDEGRYRSNDNATFWQGYAGYPVIMALMLQGRVPFNGEVAAWFKGIPWKALNDAHKRDYAAALAEAFGMQLELNTEEEAWLRGVYNKRGYPELTPNNLQQVWLPEGSTALRNDWGTAPGCYFERGGVRVIMLPGPPREVRPLLEHRVRPILAELSDAVIASHNVHFYGIGESEMEYRLRGYMEELTNPTLAPYAKSG